MEDGHPVERFTSRDHGTQLAKFESLLAVYGERVPQRLLDRFRALAAAV